MVMDDDIIIDWPRLNKLFEIRHEQQVPALQPAFEKPGKISYAVTRVQPGNTMRYTSFIEMACPLFSIASLTAFLDVLDPALTDFGMDYWFLQVIGAHLPKNMDRVAVVDSITCMNPQDWNKRAFKPPQLILSGSGGGGPAVTSTREIDKLGDQQERMAVWRRISKKRGLATNVPYREYRKVDLSVQ